jgi:hypothetical protein
MNPIFIVHIVNWRRRQVLLNNELFKVMNIQPFIEQFYGSNNIHYRHTYYIAQYVGERDVSYDVLNSEMTREIGNLAWKNLDEAILLASS